MLDRIRLQEGEKILIPGASGGVGSALIQLAKRRKAQVFAITSKLKMDMIRDLGADHVIDRNQKDLEMHGATVMQEEIKTEYLQNLPFDRFLAINLL